MKSIFEKTRVGFGSPELSLRLSCTEFCALSSGHGPRQPWFEGGRERFDFHYFLEVQNNFLFWSDLDLFIPNLDLNIFVLALNPQRYHCLLRRAR